MADDLERLQWRLATACAVEIRAEQILDETAKILEDARNERRILIERIERAKLEEAINYPNEIFA